MSLHYLCPRAFLLSLNTNATFLTTLFALYHVHKPRSSSSIMWIFWLKELHIITNLYPYKSESEDWNR